MQQNEIKLDMLHRLSIQELSDLILQCKTMINLKGGKQSTLKEGQIVTIDSPKLLTILTMLMVIDGIKIRT